VAERSSTTSEGNDSGPSDFDEGRYLYCVVDADDRTAASLAESGVDGQTPFLIERDGLGAVVHDCDAPYESNDPGTVREWLLDHQAVVDESGETFGTPLPFRFGTILKGNDERVREWLDEEAGRLRDALADFAGQWEYRIEVLREANALDDRLAAENDRLAELQERRRDASEGTAFLVEKQYERALREVRERRLREEAAALADRLADIASEVETVDRSGSLLDDDREAEDAHRSTLTVLAPEAREENLGDVLDEYAERPEVEIRFTGPWPPYSFAPELGDDP
jgi:hypothetical protein